MIHTRLEKVTNPVNYLGDGRKTVLTLSFYTHFTELQCENSSTFLRTQSKLTLAKLANLLESVDKCPDQVVLSMSSPPAFMPLAK